MFISVACNEQFFYREDGRSAFLQNFNMFLPENTPSYRNLHSHYWQNISSRSI